MVAMSTAERRRRVYEQLKAARSAMKSETATAATGCHAKDDKMKDLNEISTKAMEKLRLLAQRKYCGAKTRKGTPCRRVDIYSGGRCRLHGGFSTGPKTEEGKARSALNGFCPKRKQSS